MTNFEFRYGEKKDAALLLTFIKKIAEYEKMSDEVEATEETLSEWIFDKHGAEVLFVLKDGKEIGYALWFTNFSTFVGKCGLYLEDLYVLPEYRKIGAGKALFTALAKIAHERNYGRFEWSCLDWNKPSIGFYLSMGAKPMDEWTVYRLAGDALAALAKGDKNNG